MAQHLKSIVKEFESWGEYLEYVSKNPDKSYITHSRRTTKDDYWAGDFTKTKDFQECLDLAHNGWLEGADKVKAISEPMFMHVSSLVERHDIVHDVEGIQVDIARYLDGEPECWIQWEPKILQGPGTRILRLVLNGTFSGGVSTDTIEKVGALVTSLVELLEYSGIRVEVFLSQNFKDTLGAGVVTPGETYVRAHTKIKSADQPLDIPRLSYVFGHPSCLRRLGFSFLEQQPMEYRKQMGSSYGWCGMNSLKGDIIIPEMHLMNDWTRTPETAEAWIIKQLEAQGVELKKVVK